MKRKFINLAIATLSLGITWAHNGAQIQNPTQQNERDTISMEGNLQQVHVIATRATKSTPVAYANLSKSQIERNSYGLDIPSLLALTPSMIATNETGIGIGGTSIRLRGTDATRLNVTVNGMSLNNPDSHSTYWYDTPDLISAIGDVQVQRGAGTSTNGTGAFGGAVSMTTAAPSSEAGGEASLSYGSYNTNKQAVRLSSGILNNHWAIDARMTHIGSDGYIERGATDLKSYMLQGAYYSDRTTIKLLSFGGKAKTGLTYTGVTKEEMELYGRRYHTEGQYPTSNGPHVLADGTHVDYYDDQSDNYLQINNQLIINQQLNEKWNLSATGYYSYGYGYYKQYKDARTLLEYSNLGISDSSVEADMVRRKIMRTHTTGLNLTTAYTSEKLQFLAGGSWSYYTSPHWGELDWVDGLAESAIAGRWYDNDVNKQDANLFAKALWSVARGLTLFGDLQYRYVSYKAWGVNDNYDWNTMSMQPIDVDKRYNFFNPRAGVNYSFAEYHNLFASFAIAQKEPTRSDFTDRYMFAADQTEPKPERLYDYELGYQFKMPNLALGANFYYMRYKDQLIPTGMVNDSSDALNVNVPLSYRAGVELTAMWSVARWLTLGGNATFSRNKIIDYVDLLADSPTYGENLGDMTIAYSPEAVASAFAEFKFKQFEAVLNAQHVGKQYFTNNQIEALSLDAYTVANLDLAYTLSTRNTKSVRIGVSIYNLLNNKYCSNGYGYSYMWDGERYDEAYYFPQAPLHVLANVTVKF